MKNFNLDFFFGFLSIKKIAIIIILLAILSSGFFVYNRFKIFLSLYPQLSRQRIGTAVSLQPEAQKFADYVGSEECAECHKQIYKDWKSSYHSKMIQSVKERPEAIIGDFSKFPSDADFIFGL